MNVDRLNFYPPKDVRIGPSLSWALVGAKVWFFNTPENLWRVGHIVESYGHACIVENKQLDLRRWSHVHDCYTYREY